MKLHISHHPDLGPMSNSPEEPAPPLKGLTHPLLPATDRHNHGRAHLGHAINYWLGRSNLTTRQLSRIADWGMDERGWLADSKIAELRRNRFSRPLSTSYCDALGAANQAIWLWQVRGEDATIAKLGLPETYKVKRDWLAAAHWLPHPEYENEALTPADWFEIAAGHLELDYVQSPVLAPNEGPQISEELCQLLLRLVPPDLPTRDKLRTVLKAYPVSDTDRRERLGQVLMGISTYSAEDFEAELYSLSQIVRHLRGLSARDYGPCELYAELTLNRKQSGGNADDD